VRYSNGRIRNLSRKILEKCKEDGALELLVQDSLAINEIADTIEKYFSIEDEVYEIVINDLDKRTKKLIPGSMEWEIVFNKKYEEEISKRLMG